MDPLGVGLSIISIAELTQKLVGILKDAKNAPKEVSQFVDEANSLRGLLMTLEDRIDRAPENEQWYTALRRTEPIFQLLRARLGELDSTLDRKNPKELAGFLKRLTWSHAKSEVSSVLGVMERLKSLILIALREDDFALEIAIKQDIATISSKIDALSDNVSILSNEVQNRFEDITTAYESRYSIQDRYRIINWISSLDFIARQREISSMRHPGTGTWFTDLVAFQRWRDGESESSILLCTGIPGCGKTFIASTAITHLEQRFQSSTDIATLCVFFNHKEQDMQTVPNIIASTLRQLVQHRSTVSDQVRRMYDLHMACSSYPRLEELLTVIQSEIHQSFSRVYIIIDALDEAADDNVRSKLLTILRHQSDLIRILITTRHGSLLEQDLGSFERIEIEAHELDLQAYIEGRLCDETRLRRLLKQAPDLLRTVVDTISSRCKGMFLLAWLHVDALKSKNNRKALLLALGQLPSSLDATYEEAMARIKAQNVDDKELAEAALSWVAYSHRLLTLEELRHALSVNLNDQEFSIDGLPDIGILISACAGLIAVDKSSTGVVRLVHYTAQEYFDRTRSKWFPDADVYIGSTCLTYLAFREVSQGPTTTKKLLSDRLIHYSLLDYAANFWGDHIRNSDRAEDKQRVWTLLEHPGILGSVSQVILDQDSYDHLPNKWKGFSAIHMVAYFNLSQYMIRLLDSGVYSDAGDSRLRTPLSYAAERGNDLIAELLLHRTEVDSNAPDTTGRVPLIYAAEQGRENTLKVLLGTSKVHINSQDSQGRTPLSHASEFGNLSVVKLLLGIEGIDPELSDMMQRTPLSYAAACGHLNIVELLLQNPAVDAGSQDRYKRTPMLLAVQAGHLEVVQALLLQPNNNADHVDSKGRGLLSYCTSESMAKLLLFAANVSPEVTDDTGRCPLSYLVERGALDAARLLLQNTSVDPDSKDNNGRTPLSYATSKEMSELLLSTGHIDVNSKDIDDRTLISHAVRHESVACYLLAAMIWHLELNQPDQHGMTPLSHAILEGSPNVIRSVLGNPRVHRNRKDQYGQTSLIHLTRRSSRARDVEICKLLLDSGGIKVDVKDTFGRTALSYAAEQNRRGVICLLLEHGANPSMRDEKGRVAACYAAMSGSEEAASLLLDFYDPGYEDNDGRTLISYSAEGGKFSIFSSLLERSVQAGVVDYTDAFGRTSLSYACENGKVGIVAQLLKRSDVNVNSCDTEQCTPLIHAVKARSLHVVKLMVSCPKVHVNCQDKHGRPALSYAPLAFSSDLMKFLLSRDDIQVNLTDEHGRTALSYAAEIGLIEGVFALLAHSAIEADAKDNVGRTPLSYAENIQIARLFTSRDDVDVNSRATDGHTILSRILEKHNLKQKEVLPALLDRWDLKITKAQWSAFPEEFKFLIGSRA